MQGGEKKRQASPALALGEADGSDGRDDEGRNKKRANVRQMHNMEENGECNHMPMHGEPALPEVHKDDRMMVRNMLYVAKAIQLSYPMPIFSSWQVQVRQDGYVVVLFLHPGFTLSSGDLDMFKEVSPLRVQSICIVGNGSTDRASDSGGEGTLMSNVKPQIRIRLVDHQQPIMMTEVEVVKVVKKKRGWFHPFT